MAKHTTVNSVQQCTSVLSTLLISRSSTVIAAVAKMLVKGAISMMRRKRPRGSEHLPLCLLQHLPVKFTNLRQGCMSGHQCSMHACMDSQSRRKQGLWSNHFPMTTTLPIMLQSNVVLDGIWGGLERCKSSTALRRPQTELDLQPAGRPQTAPTQLGA